MRLSRFVAFIAVVEVLSGGISIAQQPQQAKPLQFEVATIRPSDPKAMGASYLPGGPGGQFRFVNMPLEQWVEIGFSVSGYALKAPPWLDTARFDLEARLPSEPANQQARAEMMKTLLVERFGLKWHEESQSVSGYELLPDKKVLVEPSGLLERLKGSGSSSGPTLLAGTNIPMSELAEQLGKLLGKPVVDATHLSGVFSFKLMWRPSDDAVIAEQKRHGIDVDNLPATVFNALREQSGLRLQSARVPTKLIVVDNINRQPTEN